MAQETKVGLLAGLAFIICFAVILTNRGRDYPPRTGPDGYGTPTQPGSFNQPPVDREGDNSYSQGTDTRRAALSHNQERAHASRNGGNQSVPAVGQRTTPSNQRTDNAAGGTHPWAKQSSDFNVDASGQQVAENTHGANAERSYRPSDGDRGYADARGRRFDGFEPSNAFGGNGATVDQDRIAQLEAHLADARKRLAREQEEHHAGNGAYRSLAGKPVSTPVPRAAKQRKYTVQKGDTLTSIAQRHYGDQSRDVLNAIFDANRAEMPDLNHIRVGMDLILPSIGESYGSRSARQSERTSDSRSVPADRTFKRDTRVTNGKPSRPGNSGTVRWYEVRANDSYIKIARRELGDEQAWQTIAELNRDIFPDAERIRSGVRIRLPRSAR